MDFRFALAVVALALFTPACSALIAPDTNRLGHEDAGPHDAAIGDLDAALPDGARPDAARDDGGPPAPDAGAMCPASCDDSVACTTDACDMAAGACTHAPNDAACGDGMRCAGPAGCVPILCTTSTECDDGNACNGAETCSPRSPGASPTTGCVPGDAPDCNDGADCTEDHCNPDSGCFHLANDAACGDGADCTTDTCTPTGCAHAPDDSMCNGGCRTGAVCMAGVGCTGGSTMTCSTDGNPCTSDPVMCDASSGMCVHPTRDDDGDGHLIARATGTSGMTMVCGGDDCNDMNGAVHPGATEVCNGIDDNCEGGVDEGCASVPDACSSEQRIVLTGGSGTPLTGSASGNNGALGDDYRSSCGNTGGRDAVYYVDLPAGALGAVDVTVSTDHASTSYDTVLAARTGTCGGFTRPCQDDISSGNSRSTITFCVTPSAVSTTQVHILVDGFDGGGGSTGDYTVSVSVSPHPGGICG
jgi:hypothetical protein